MRINEVLNSKNYIVEDEKPQVRPKLSMRELDVKAKEELTDKIFTYPGGPRQTEYFNIPFTATIQKAKTEYFKSNQVSVGNAVDKAVKYYQDNPAKAEVEVKKERSFATARVKDAGGTGIPTAGRKRGAQLGNQNARKNWSQSGIAGGIGKVADIITKGTLDNTSPADAAKTGSDLAKDIGKGLDAMSQVRKPKNMGNVFGS